MLSATATVRAALAAMTALAVLAVVPCADAARHYTAVRMPPALAGYGGTTFLDTTGAVAISGDGRFRSTDGGRTWTTIGPEVAGPFVPEGDGCAYAPTRRICPTGPVELLAGWPYGHSTLIARDSPSTIYVLGAPDVSVSVDGGAHWDYHAAPVNTGVLGLGGYLLGLDPSGGLQLSHDGGHSWAQPSTARVTNLVADDRRPRVFYGTHGADAVITTDAGATWTPLVANASSPVVMRNGTLSVVVAGRIVTSTDGGHTFHRRGLMPGVFEAGPPSTDARGDFLVSAYRSTDGGRTWHAAERGLPTAAGSVTGAGGKDLLLSAGWRGTYRSHDAGRSWSPAVLVDSYGAPTITGAWSRAYFYASDVNLVASLEPGASHWRRAHGNGAIFVDQVDARVAYSHGIRTLDGGKHWTRCSCPFDNVGNVPAPSAFTARTIYQSTALDNVSSWRVSRNAGKTWAVFGHPPRYATLLQPSPLRRHVFFTWEHEQCMVSSDDAGTFHPTGSPLSCFQYTRAPGEVLVFGSHRRVWVSHDMLTWRKAFSAPARVGTILALTVARKRLFVQGTRGLFRTRLP